MEYTQHVLNRSTGDVVAVSTGNWITITEMGELKGVSPRRIRTILRKMDFLYVEGGQAHNRHRLCPWVLREGYGKHIPARKPAISYPFDVISPEGQAWIETKWSNAVEAVEREAQRSEVVQAREALAVFKGTRLGELNVQGQVLWLRDHFKDLLDTEIAHILDVTQQVVSRYASLQDRQRKSSELRKEAVLDDIGKVRLSKYHEGEA